MLVQLLAVEEFVADIKTSLISQPTDNSTYSTKRVNLSLISKIFSSSFSQQTWEF